MLRAQDVLDYIRKCPDELAETLRKEHRTNQQSVAGGILIVLRSLGAHDTDLRNEASVKWAKQAADLQPYVFPFI